MFFKGIHRVVFTQNKRESKSDIIGEMTHCIAVVMMVILLQLQSHLGAWENILH